MSDAAAAEAGASGKPQDENAFADGVAVGSTPMLARRDGGAIGDGGQAAAGGTRAARDGAKKSEPDEPSANAHMSAPQKAALIISALGPEAAAPLLKEFGEDEVRSFARASAQLADVAPEAFDETVREFMRSMGDARLSMSPDKLKEILSTILNEDAIERILEDMNENDGRSIWEKVSNSDPVDLVNYLSKEHPQTVAVVMSRIKPDMSAKVMARLDQDFAEEVIMRLSNISALGTAVLDAVKDSIESEFLRNARMRKSKRKPDEMIGAIMNFMQSDKRDALMGGIESRSPQLASQVQRKMFTFADIPARVERVDVSKLMRQVEPDILLRALKTAKKNAPETTDYIFSSISRRLAEQYEERIAAIPPPNQRDGEDAQFQVIGVIRKLAESGEIELRAPEDDEEDDDY